MSTAVLESKPKPQVNGVVPEHYEVINGRIVELPPMGAAELRLSNLIARDMWQSLLDPRAGEVFIEMLFRLAPDAKRDRRPDLAYVPYARFPDRLTPFVNAWSVIPALAAEIVSETNTANEIRGKIDDYFKYGVELVWVIYPHQRKVEVYTGLKTVTILDENDTLDGGTVLPNFRLSLATLFAVVPREEA